MVLACLVLLPVAFNAVMLTAELRPVPHFNDDAWQYLFVQRASLALAEGANPFDHWTPELDCGFPYFLYYQHLPHLAVVALNRLTLKRIDLLTLYNWVRYLLLIGFPLTVYWSMRTMEFSAAAAATGAAFASLISAPPYVLGFEYNSYLFWGSGMYTQLWAVHLLFIATGCLQRLLARGTNYAAAAVTWSLLVLSHLFYACLGGITALVLLGLSVGGRSELHLTAGRKLWIGVVRVGAVAIVAAVITSYFWLPLALAANQLRQVALPHMMRKEPGSGASLMWLALHGQLLDYQRAPLVTAIAAVGIVAAILKLRAPPARLALSLFVVWSVLCFALPQWPSLTGKLPLGGLLPPSRVVAGLDMAAILLIGLAGERMWSWCSLVRAPWCWLIFGISSFALMVPALRERRDYYRADAEYIAEAAAKISDPGWRDVVETLKAMPPGRTYLMLDLNRMTGQRLIPRLLLFHDLETLQAAIPLSMNAALPMLFDQADPVHYNLFNVRYVIAPAGLPVPPFLTPVRLNDSYGLYGAETTGYAQFAAIEDFPVPAGIKERQRSILEHQQQWLFSSAPGRAAYLRWDYRSGVPSSYERSNSGTPDTGTVLDQTETGGRIVLHVNCRAASNLVLKVTYHPNWHLTIDGREQSPFEVSPSYLAAIVPAGRHEIVAEYRSSVLKKVLLVVGACSLIATITLRRRLYRLARFVERANGPQ
ncbi:MAG: hypothetical protein WA005_12980 [Candidatus Binataceae bacterium]